MSERNDRVQELLESGKEGSRYTRIACPFCADDGHRDRKLSLSYNQRTGWWKCFRCEAVGRLGDHEDEGSWSDDEDEDDSEVLFEPLEEFVPLYDDRSMSMRPARDYLRSRGVPKSLWRELQIHGCCDGWYANRIIVPHLSVDRSRWLGWIARVWVPEPAPNAQRQHAQKYLYPPGMQKDLLYNHCAVLEETDVPVILVEGAFDSFPHQPDAAAFLGSMSEAQHDALLHAERPLCFVMDGDKWIYSHAYALKLRLRGKATGCVRLPAGADPAVFDARVLRKAARRSIGRFDPIDLRERF